MVINSASLKRDIDSGFWSLWLYFVFVKYESSFKGFQTYADKDLEK